MIYCDTSLLVAVLTPEPHSAAARAWLAAQPAAGLAASPWVDTEFASAIAVKVRTRALSDAYLADALAGWRQLKADSLRIEPVAAHHFREAALLASRPDLKLRAGDALHLAIAVDRGFGLAALDRNLVAAAKTVGVRAESILPTS